MTGPRPQPTLGQVVRALRVAHGFGMNEFAIMTELDSANLSRFERGLCGGLKVPEKLYPIAEALGTRVSVLFLLLEKACADPALLAEPGEVLWMVGQLNEVVDSA